MIEDTPIITIPCITDIPTIMQTCNPTAKRALKHTKRLHHRVTRNDTPGIMPVPSIAQERDTATPIKLCRSPQTNMRLEMRPTGQQCALIVLTLQQQASFCTVHTPCSLMRYTKMRINYKHYACPMVHPITGQTISSYKTIIHNPVTAKVWQTASGRDIGGIAQGENKTGQKGTNPMFVMTHNKIAHAYAAQKFFTYGNLGVDYCPPKNSHIKSKLLQGKI